MTETTDSLEETYQYFITLQTLLSSSHEYPIFDHIDPRIVQDLTDQYPNLKKHSQILIDRVLQEAEETGDATKLQQIEQIHEANETLSEQLLEIDLDSSLDSVQRLAQISKETLDKENSIRLLQEQLRQ